MALFPTRIFIFVKKKLTLISCWTILIIILTTPFQRLQAVHEVVGAFKDSFLDNG